MGFFDNLFGINKQTELRESIDLHNNIRQDLARMVELRESNGMAALYREDLNWAPVSGWATGDGFDIRHIKDESDTCRMIYAVNPMMKKAVTARIGMIHGRGSRIVAVNEGQQARLDLEVKKHERKIFGSVAKSTLEAELSTTGNVFVMKEGNKEAVVVPITQITGYVSDVDEPSRVLYWRRGYTTQRTDLQTGQHETIVVDEYIPSPHNTAVVSNIGDTPVRRTARLHHIAANRQEGWVLGLPDIYAAKFWTKGHKEMFEAGHEFALAQGKVAAKVTVDKGMGSQLAASRLADEPRRDMETGEVYGYGGTVSMSGGMDYQLMGKMGSGIDFKSYDRVAGLIAAGTGVPLDVLLATSDSEEVSLEQTVVDDMKLRQQLWGEFYQDFLQPFDVTVVWPRIKQESTYRAQQGIEIANRTNTLTAEQKTLLALESFGLEGNPNEVPDIMDHPDVQVYLAKKRIDLQYAAQIAAASVTPGTEGETDTGRSTSPDQGNDQGIGKLSDGSDAKDLRDAGEQEHTK